MPASRIDARTFRQALGAFATGVTVVTTLQADGTPRGFTANSFTSVSLDPPLILVCIAKAAASCPVFSAAPRFAISILAEHQKDLSSLFASKAQDKFAAAEWFVGPAGSPVIAEAAAWFDCRRHDLIEAGDHLILIGEVVGFDHTPARPLGYCRGAYITFGLAQEAIAAAGERVRVGAILDNADAIVFIEATDGTLDLPVGRSLEAGSDPTSLRGELRRLGIAATIDFLFAVFQERSGGSDRTSIYYRGSLDSPLPQESDARVIALGEIPWARVRDPAVRSMLERFVRERREDTFGIYVGDAERGTVQTLARPA